MADSFRRSWGISPRRHGDEALSASPSDERLVDYLLGVSSCQENGVVLVWTDEQIEKWVESHPLHLDRLESVAASIVALASGADRFAGVVGLYAGIAADASHDEYPSRGMIRPEGIQRVEVKESRWSGIGSRSSVWAVSTALALVVSGFSWWFFCRPTPDSLAAALAIAWSEDFSLSLPAIELAIEPALSDLELREVALMEDSLESVEEENESWPEGAFADGSESPPDWLVLAVSKLDSQPEITDTNDGGQ